jgi:hypothetical protein
MSCPLKTNKISAGLLMLFLCIVGIATDVSSTTNLGGVGLIYVHSATTLPKGYLEFYTGTRYFGKIASFRRENSAYTLWDVQSFFSLNYGAGKHVEVALSPILYQDINGSGGNFWKGSANFPDDIFVSIKAGSFTGLESPFTFGGLLNLRLPVAKKHNIIYEPYSAGTVEFGITALASYYRNITFPETGWSIHANLGYLNHNDVGKNLSDVKGSPTPQSMSSEVLAGCGLLYPAGTFDFSVEITARDFHVPPPVSAYSMEYVSYLTFGIYYKPYRWLSFEMALDKSLLVGEDLTDYRYLTSKIPDFPNYPGWRGVLGVKVVILPASLRTTDTSDLKQKTKDRQVILEKMIDNQTDMESAERELTRIQSERKKVEEELERLRKMLEEEKHNEPKK